MSKRIVSRSAKSTQALLLKQEQEKSVEPEKPMDEKPKDEKPKDEKPKKDTRCMSRITQENHAQYFGNQRNKFYLEFRCSLPRFRDEEVCIRCLSKSESASQDSRRFDHGKINEPIPDASHLFGGGWYQEGVIKWGEPSEDHIRFARMHQEEARGPYVIQQPIYDDVSSKVNRQSSFQEDMPKKQKADTALATVLATKESVLQEKEEKPKDEKPKDEKPKRKPRAKKAVEEEQKEQKPKAKAKGGRKKAEASPYQALASDQRLIYKEVTLPTHQEHTMEEVDLDDFTVVYVELRPFEFKGVNYYRDEIKQKIYRRIREKQVGDYVGRYDPTTETLYEDVPDSDDE